MRSAVLNPMVVLLLGAAAGCSEEKTPSPPPAGSGGAIGTGGASVGSGGAVVMSGGTFGTGGGVNAFGGFPTGGSTSMGQGGSSPVAGSGGMVVVAQGGKAAAGAGSGAGGAAAGAAGSAAGGASAGSGGSAGSAGAAGSQAGAGGSGGSSDAWMCPGGPYSATPISKSSSPMRITGAPPSDAFNNQGNDFGIIEGPVWREGALYFSEFGSGNTPNSRILRVGSDGQVSIAIPDAGTNGLALDNAGQLLGANHKLGAITRITLPGGASTSLVTEFMGQRFNSPNDIAVRKDGNLYFTDPSYQAPSTPPQSATRVYRVAPSATTATAVVEGRQNPNGIALSPDGNTLYVGASDGVFSYPVMADGAVGSGTRLTGTSTDGMAVDCAGNLYLTSNAEVVAVSPAGMELGRFTVSGIQSVTNVAFGGAERKTLYITSLGSGTQRGLFRVDVANPGFPY